MKSKTERKGLSPEELIAAQSLIAQSPNGEYRLKDLYGDMWEAVPGVNSYGRRFKSSVERGSLTGITYKMKDDANTAVYIIG